MQQIRQARNRLLAFPLSTMALLVLIFTICHTTVDRSFTLQSQKATIANAKTRDFIIDQYQTIAAMIAEQAMGDFTGMDTQKVQMLVTKLDHPLSFTQIVVTDTAGAFVGGSRLTYDKHAERLMQHIRAGQLAKNERSAHAGDFVAAALKSHDQVSGWIFVFLDMTKIERIMEDNKLDQRDIEDDTHLSLVIYMGIFVILGSLLSYLLYRLAYAALMGDVKKRIVAEYYYAESEANLARAQELTHIGNWKYEASIGKLKVSKELLKIFGMPTYRKTKIAPLTIMRRIAKEQRAELVQKLRGCAREKKCDSMELAIDIGGGVSRHLSVIFDYGASREKKSAHLFGTVQDITARVVAEQQQKQVQYALYQSSKMASLGLMSASIVHELKNPLTAVMGYAELMQTHQNDGLDSKTVLEKMLNAASRMRSVVDHLRSYCREDKDSDFEKIDPNEPISNALQFLHHLAKREDIAYDLSLAADLPAIKGKGSLLESVFQNLISNSMDAFIEGKIGGKRVITVVSSVDNDQILIVYKDNAGGMSGEVSAKIFEAFFTTKPVGKGTGLGMSITQNIIQDHGGTITVQSEINKGTCFEIRLPKYQAAVQPSSSRAA